MGSPVDTVITVLAWAATVAMLYAVVWSIVDVVIRATDVSLLRRALWVLLLLGLNAIAAALYMNVGPGAKRWRASGAATP